MLDTLKRDTGLSNTEELGAIMENREAWRLVGDQELSCWSDLTLPRSARSASEPHTLLSRALGIAFKTGPL